MLERLKCDILILGSGGAGLFAALHAYQANPDLDAAAGFALRYFQDKIAPNRVFRLASDQERAAILDLRTRLLAFGGPEAGQAEDEALQTICYAVGKEHGFEPLRDWFKALYEVLLGASEGPRFGGFIALYGVTETVALIDKALAGELAG